MLCQDNRPREALRLARVADYPADAKDEEDEYHLRGRRSETRSTDHERGSLTDADNRDRDFL